MKINFIEMVEDELKSTKDYFTWSKAYKNRDLSVSDRMYEISKEELSHARFWIDMLIDRGKDVSKYEEEYNKLYKMIYGGEDNE